MHRIHIQQILEWTEERKKKKTDNRQCSYSELKPMVLTAVASQFRLKMLKEDTETISYGREF